MHPLIHAVDRLSEWSGRLIAWATLGMVVITFTVVVLRYGFDLGWIALQESALYLHALVFMVGAAYTLRRNGHVRVDIFYQRLSPRGQAWVDLLGHLLFTLPLCAFIGWSAGDYVMESWALREGSREAGGLPWVYLLKTLLLIMPTLLALQAVAEILRRVLFLRGRTPEPTPEELGEL